MPAAVRTRNCGLPSVEMHVATFEIESAGLHAYVMVGGSAGTVRLRLKWAVEAMARYVVRCMVLQWMLLITMPCEGLKVRSLSWTSDIGSRR